MWLLIKNFFGGLSAKTLEIAAIVGASVLAVIAIFQEGKKSARSDALQSQSKMEGKAHGIENENRADLHDGDAAKQLQSDWSR